MSDTKLHEEKAMRLDAAVQDYLVDHRLLSPQTQGWYTQKLGVFEKWCKTQHLDELESLTGRHLTAFQAWLLEQSVATVSPAHPYQKRLLSPFTVRGYAQVVKSFSHWTTSEGYLSSDPFSRVKKVKEPDKVIEPFTQEHIKQLLDATKGTSHQAIRDRAIILFLLDTGVRVNEFANLLLPHLHLQEASPWVQVDWRTSKGRKDRELSLGREAVRSLNRYLRMVRTPYDPRDQHVWLNRYRRPFTTSGVRQAIQDVGRMAEVKGVRVSPHTFRHTFSKSFIEQGGDVFTLSRLLGHASVSVTEHYLRGFRARDARKQQHSSVADLLLSS